MSPTTESPTGSIAPQPLTVHLPLAKAVRPFIKGGPLACAGSLDGRRNILIDGLNGLGWNLEKPKAAFYVWVPTPPGYDAMGFAKALLEQAGVLAIPGVGYGPYGENYVRMSLTVAGDKNGEKLQEAVARIKANIELRW